ncbi:MAG: DsbA family protein [Alphaproteobacteria bacterium]
MSLKPVQLIALVAVVVVIGAGIVYYLTGQSDQVSLTGGEAANSTTDAAAARPDADDAIMVAGPLGEMTLGDASAPNVIIEYVSMTCSHCRDFHNETYASFKEQYIDTGKVYFIMREFPLDPLATSAIMLARCAPSERYFPMVGLMFEEQRNWAFTANPVTALQKLVKQAGISQEEFRACLTNQEILDGVLWVKNRGAEEFGVGSTPTFFINGERFPGNIALDQIAAAIGG